MIMRNRYIDIDLRWKMCFVYGVCYLMSMRLILLLG